MMIFGHTNLAEQHPAKYSTSHKSYFPSIEIIILMFQDFIQNLSGKPMELFELLRTLGSAKILKSEAGNLKPSRCWTVTLVDSMLHDQGLWELSSDNI